MERILASSIREQGKNLGPVIEESEGMRVDAGRIAERIEVVHKELSLQPVGGGGGYEAAAVGGLGEGDPGQALQL